MHLACHLNLNLQRDLCRSQMRPTYIYVNTFSKETYIHICKYICTYIYTANCIWSVSEYQSQKRPMWVSKETYIYICKYIYIHIYKRPTQETYKQTIAIGVSLNLNLQSLSHWSFFNRTHHTATRCNMLQHTATAQSLSHWSFFNRTLQKTLGECKRHLLID